MWSGFTAHRERGHAGGGSPAPVTTATFRPAVTAKHRGEERVREDPTKGDPGESQPLQIQTFHLPLPQMPSPPPKTNANTKTKTRKRQFTTTTIANARVRPRKR